MDGCCERDVAIFLCTFSLHVESANVLIKFPCQYFLEWKTANGKKTAQGRTRPTARNSLVEFNETLELTTEMMLDRSSNAFLRKETLLNLNLISKARQDQVKLIGRVAIDLADLANRNDYARARPFKLSYCSVDAELTFSATTTSKRETTLTPQDLDKSSFNEFLSFRSCGSNPKEKQRPDATITDGQETSIGYGRQPQEHAIDIPCNQRHSRPFNQTFFMFSSPNKTVRRDTAIKPPSEQERSSLRSELAGRSPSNGKDAKDVNYSRSTQLTNVRIQQEAGSWEREKMRFRGEIDGNRQKIEQLQRKITELSVNLEDSKRHLQFTEKQNRQKEEIIKILKQSELKPETKNEPEPGQNMHIKQCLQLQEKIDRLTKEHDLEGKQWRNKQDSYKGQISQYQASIDLLRKETEDLRRMWQERRENYEQKARDSEARVREREAKVVQLTAKVEDLLRFKYQYEILKQLSEEKDQKLKNTEKSLSKLRFEIEQINKNNYAEQIYQLKLQLAQSQKAHEELTTKHSKCDEETTRYRESYIKIEAAFELQAKNYENCKQKNLQQETVIYNLHKDSMELKNSLANANKAMEELNYKLIASNNQQAIKVRANEDVQRQLKKALLDIQSGSKEKEELRATIDRLRIELQAKSRDFQDKIRRIESTIIAAHDQKQKQLKEQQEKLVSHIADLQANISQLQSIKQDLQQSVSNLSSALSELKVSTQSDIKKKDGLIVSLESVVADKQEIIKMSNNQLEAAKEANRELTDTLRKMSAKEKQLEENIIILEEQSHKILYILEQKELLDGELEELQANYKSLLENNQKYAHDIEEQRSRSQERLKLIEEKDSVIVEKERMVAEKESILQQLQSKLQQLHTKIIQYKEGSLSLQHELFQKDAIIQSQLLQIQTAQNELLQSHSTLQAIKDETSHSQNEITKLRNIIRDINQRYEEHIKTEQRYQRELDIIRQEKEDLEVYISRNNNEFAIYNQELEQRIGQYQKEMEKLENELAFANDERRLFDQKCVTLQSEKKELINYLQTARAQAHQQETQKHQLINILQEKGKQIEQLKRSCQAGLIRITQLQSEIANLHSNLVLTKNQSEKVAARLQEKAQQLQAHQSSLHLMQSQHDNLTMHLQNLHEQMQSDANQAYNELVELQVGEGEVMAAQSILEERRVVEQEKYDELNMLLCENQDKVRRLEDRIEELNLQIRNLVYQLEKKAQEHEQLQKRQKEEKGLFEDFPQFHREEMTKIIEQQRRQIDRLEAETKMKTSKNSSVLEDRIRQLQSNIVELQSSFRMEIDRILNGHASNNNREAEGTLSVINEDNEEDTLRSEKSAAATPNRVKLSMESEVEWREKALALEEEKRQLEGQLQASEEEKFNLLSTINEKDIQLQEALRMKLMLENEADELKRLNQHAQAHLSSLAAEVQSLRNQVNFGTSILLNEQSVTRSEPVINQQQNNNEGHFREAQIEHLRAQVERGKAREEELAWNIRDLEMQLETVTESLNLLNGSSMNSFLNGSGKLSEEEQPNNVNGDRDGQETGYNKERLLQSLKRNEELKEMARGIIRALQQREKEAQQQQKLLKDLASNRAIINSAISNRNTLKLQAISKKIGPICKEFQTIKILTTRETHEQDGLRALLGFQQKLKDLLLLCERDEGLADY